MGNCNTRINNKGLNDTSVEKQTWNEMFLKAFITGNISFLKILFICIVGH